MMNTKSHLKIVTITDRKLKKKFQLNRFMDCSKALSIKPILPNAFALVLGFLILYVLGTSNLLPPMPNVIRTTLKWAVYGLLFYQVIRSAFKSIILPIGLVLIAGIGFMFLAQHWVSSTWINATWLQAAMLVGIVGIFTFSIDIE